MLLIEAAIDMKLPNVPKATINQWKYFLCGVIWPSNYLLYSRGGKMNPIIPAPSAPAKSKNVVKSGIKRAIPVTQIISNDLTPTDFSFFSCFVPVLKKACCSTISKAASI